MACLLLIACQDETQKPNPFIEEDKMEAILYDVALLYGIQTTSAFSNDNVTAFNMSDIFQKYDIDSLSFANNNKYYMQLKKNVYYAMQNRVLDRLVAQQKIADSISSNDMPKFKNNDDKDEVVEDVLINDSLVSTTNIENVVKEKPKQEVKKAEKSAVNMKEMSAEKRQRFQKIMREKIDNANLEKVE